MGINVVHMDPQASADHPVVGGAGPLPPPSGPTGPPAIPHALSVLRKCRSLEKTLISREEMSVFQKQSSVDPAAQASPGARWWEST